MNNGIKGQIEVKENKFKKCTAYNQNWKNPRNIKCGKRVDTKEISGLCKYHKEK